MQLEFKVESKKKNLDSLRQQAREKELEEQLESLSQKIVADKCTVQEELEKLTALYGELARVNCNVHPLKQNIKAHWQLIVQTVISRLQTLV